jgi:hypothetical protein
MIPKVSVWHIVIHNLPFLKKMLNRLLDKKRLPWRLALVSCAIQFNIHIISKIVISKIIISKIIISKIIISKIIFLTIAGLIDSRFLWIGFQMRDFLEKKIREVFQYKSVSAEEISTFSMHSRITIMMPAPEYSHL